MRPSSLPTPPRVQGERTIALLRELIGIPSVNPPGNEGKVAKRLAQEFTGAGLHPELHEVLPERPNLILQLGSGRSPHLWLNAHMDTVDVGDRGSWTHAPFAAALEDGKIFGRGSTDDKGGLAAMAAAVIAVAEAGVPLGGTVTFTAVMGEELGNLGTRSLIDGGFVADMAIVGEYSSARRIAAGYRGCLWLEVTTHGRGAHGSRPHEGVNAIYAMTETVIPALRQLSMSHRPAPRFLVSEPTISVNTINGGTAVNVIPDRCRTEVDIRLVPGQSVKGVLGEVNEALDRCRELNPSLSVDIAVLQASEPFWTPTETPLVDAVRVAVKTALGVDAELFGKSGTSDGNVIAGSLGIPVIAYGPGNGSGHGPNEFVEVDDVIDVANVLAAAIMRICG